MAVDIQSALSNFIKGILGDSAAAAEFVADEQGVMATAGILDQPFTAAELQQAVADACAELDLPGEVQQALVAYAEGNPQPLAAPSGGGGGAAAGVPPVPNVSDPGATLSAVDIQETLNYVTYVTYESNPTIINEITEVQQDIVNIDNSVDVVQNIDGDNFGDLTVDTTNITASGDGAVAGETVENAVTGDGAVLVDGSVSGQVNTGDGAVLNDGTIEGGVATGGGIATGQDSNAVISDGNTSLQADGSIDLEDTSIVSGDVGGDVVSIGDMDDSAFNTGDGGSAENLSDVQDSAISQGSGDADNISDLDDGSAVAQGGDAVGSDINDSFNDNQGQQEQGPGQPDYRGRACARHWRRNRGVIHDNRVGMAPHCGAILAFSLQYSWTSDD